MQQSIVKFIALSYRHCSTCFGHYNRPRLRKLPPPHSYGNQRLQRQFDGLLMMGIIMPETCWAVSVRQSNKFYDWLLHLVGCFIWVFRFYLAIYRSPDLKPICLLPVGITMGTLQSAVPAAIVSVQTTNKDDRNLPSYVTNCLSDLTSRCLN